MLEEKQEIIIDNYNATQKTLSIAKVLVILRDGIEIVRQVIDRCAFGPGDIDKVKAYLNMQDEPEIKYLESIWTDEVIQKTIAMQQAENII